MLQNPILTVCITQKCLTESMQDSDVDSNMHNNKCQRSRVHCQPNKHKETEKENLVPSQIIYNAEQ